MVPSQTCYAPAQAALELGLELQMSEPRQKGFDDLIHLVLFRSPRSSAVLAVEQGNPRDLPCSLQI